MMNLVEAAEATAVLSMFIGIPLDVNVRTFVEDDKVIKQEIQFVVRDWKE